MAPILAPLAASGRSITQIRPDQKVAKGYLGEPGDRQPALLINMDVLAPAGGVNSTLSDMIRYVQFLVDEGIHDGKRLVSAEALEETWKPQIGGANLDGALPDASYGLGWFVRKVGEVKIVEHGGNALGFSAYVAILPEQHLGIVMLSNVLPNPLQQSLGEQVVETLLESER
ncbi:MAG: serine hydrolase domain-containing protein [Planctomycetota bacterium]